MMKRIIAFLISLCLCASMSLADWDQIISDTYEFSVTLNDESLLVTGGGADLIDARGYSYVEVQNTAPLQQFVGGINILALDGDSSLNYYDGETAAIYIYDDSHAVLEGGRIDYISSHQRPTSDLGWPPSYMDQHIEIVCDLDTYLYNDTTNILTGNWLDGTSTPFSIELIDRTGYHPAISNIFFTPEPATLCLFALGGLLLRKKK